MSEIDRVRERYERRREVDSSYDNLAPELHLAGQAKERALAQWMRTSGLAPMRERTLLDIGCGSAGDLLGLIRFGLEPSNLVGYELLEQRVADARHRLPSAVRIECGDALEVPGPSEAFDVVYQSLVFTSLLDDAYQQRLADRMWSLAKPGGGVLWFDFAYDNPRNRDVRGVPVKRVRELFPHGELRSWRVELAPPLARQVVRVHPKIYTVLNAVPLLRTHVLCWISKA